MTKLLILGGGSCQVNAFKLARERGYATVLFDYLSDPPAASFADVHRRVSTFDMPACLEEAEGLSPDGVMTMGTDQPVFTCARIASKLGLPSLLRPGTALAVTNKAVMKRILTRHGIPTATWFLVDKHSLPHVPLAGPVVIKPVDNQGQRGVILAENARRAVSFFDMSIAFSRCSTLLCEAYYPSDEVTVNAWVHDGAAYVLAVTDRVRFNHERHIGVCAAHRFPSVAAVGKEDEIRMLAGDIARAFGIRNGPLYIQLLIGKDGILVNELSARIGGAFEDVFIPWLTGFDILGAVMDAALGLSLPDPAEFRDPGGKQVRVLMPFTGPGRIGSMERPEEILRRDYVLDARFNYQTGDTIPPFENAASRLGVIVLHAETEERMQTHLDHFYEAFRVRDTDGNEMLMDAWRIR